MATVRFSHFRLDLDAAQLCRAQTPVPLRPKTYAVLCYLLDRPGRLISKAELLKAVWGDRVVGDEVVAVSIRELRSALGDDWRAPTFIRTVHSRGFRWLAKVRRRPSTGDP